MRTFSYLSYCSLLLLTFGLLGLNVDTNTTAQADEQLASIFATHSLAEFTEEGEEPLPLGDVDSARATLWEKHRLEIADDPSRVADFEANRIQFRDAVMNYASFRSGEKPAEGYPLYIAMHGGGSAPPQLNDSQWEHMKDYYRQSVETGIYVAPRGVSDTWNLHFRGESYPLYDRLIENMIALGEVDPNQVYLLGFSAGGDGVYQISCRMPDRFAAANMSAGHPNGINPRNLINLPLLLQVGERDDAFNRHRVAAEFYLSLQSLQEEYGTGYVSELFIHHARPNNFLDNHPREAAQRIIANPEAWLNEGDRSFQEVNTNAIAWLKRHERNPWPCRLLWQIGTRASRPVNIASPEASEFNRSYLYYWLDASEANLEGIDHVDIALDVEANRIIVNHGADQLRLLLRQEMLDLSKPIEIQVEGQSIMIRVEPRLDILAQTLQHRGDPNYMFEAAITLHRNPNNQWTASAE